MKICRFCAESIPADAVVCPICRSDLTQPVLPPRSAVSELGESSLARMMLPVGRSMWAIAAGYLGLFSLILCPAPLALVIGIIAIWHLKRNPHLHGMGRAIFGVVMGALGTIGLILGLIAAAMGW